MVVTETEESNQSFGLHPEIPECFAHAPTLAFLQERAGNWKILLSLF
jgi:hypothetical protein